MQASPDRLCSDDATASLLYGTRPSDPLVLGAAALGMVIVAIVATLLPARAAAQADPSVLLRTI